MLRPSRRRATGPAEPRYYLTLDSDVVDGPSIGPKTAERLLPHGIKTIRDLMRAEPAALAVLMDTRHITPETIADWQDQARLVCTVPGLRGTHAQLLVGAGYRSGDAIAAAEADKLCADVLAFAASKDGQRVLRNGDPPDIEKIKGWLEAAHSVKAAGCSLSPCFFRWERGRVAGAPHPTLSPEAGRRTTPRRSYCRRRRGCRCARLCAGA